MKRAGGWMGGHDTPVQARLYTTYQGQRADLTGWKDAAPTSAGTTEFSSVDWDLRGRRFDDGTWLCIQFSSTNDAPCAEIHR
ncbi:hypothetical protein AB0G73_31920 [Streptomyces sp. NPDC020719]|uniref:hypothetical protein n=1 Tax=Streptomyces sp. NPDC020719 TaxID=3154896 RepID=UPI0033F45F94